jgi:hypothetical protein
MYLPFDMKKKKLALITINGNGLLIAFGNQKKKRKKNSLDNDQWQWVVDCIRQPKKSNEQFDLPVRGGKFELDL